MTIDTLYTRRELRDLSVKAMDKSDEYVDAGKKFRLAVRLEDAVKWMNMIQFCVRVDEDERVIRLDDAVSVALWDAEIL